MGTTISAELGLDGAVSGSAGCNRYRSAYEIDGDRISISRPAVTRMLCAEPEGVMEQEVAYLALLPKAGGFAIGGRTLELLAADGSRLVTFARAETG